LTYERLLSGTKFNKANRQKVGKGRQKHIGNILGGLRRDQFSGDARAYPK
jgi:hypothetical protein